MTEWVTTWATYSGPTNGTSDCRPAWEAFRAAYVASHLGETARLQMPGGVTYVFITDDSTTSATLALARLFSGGLIVEGVGGGLANLNGHVTFGCGGFLDGLGPSFKINCETVSAGSTSVTAVTHAHASRQTCDGRWSLMTGVDLQAGGYPMNTFYFDYCVPTNANATTGVITLQNPLKYSYRSTWPLNYDGSDGIAQSFGGPAMLYPLVPEWNTSVRYIKCNFSGNSGGQAFNCEIREVIFEDCETTNNDGINISQMYLCWFKGGDISGAANWEIDKMVNTIVIDGTPMTQPVVQSSSVERLIVANGAVVNNLNGVPKELVLTSDSTITTLNLGVAYGSPEVFHWAGTVTNEITANVGIAFADINSLTTITAGVITSAFGNDVQRWPVPGHTYFLKDRSAGKWRVPFRVLDISQTGVTPTGTIQITTDLTTMTGWPSWGGAIDVVPHPCPEFYRYNDVSDVTWPNGDPMFSYSKRYFSTQANSSNPAHLIETLGHTGAVNYVVSLLGTVNFIKINVSAAYAGATNPLVWHWPSAFDNYSLTRPDFSLDNTTWQPKINLRQTGERVMIGGQVPVTFSGDSSMSFPSNEDVWPGGSSGAGTTVDKSAESSALAVTVEVSMDHGVIPQNVAMTAFEREQLADVFLAIPELYDYYPLSYLRPDADISIGTWKNETDSTTNLYQSVDEVTAGDTDYIKSSSPPDGSVARFSLSNITAGSTLVDPVVVRYRFKKTSATDYIMAATLKQGTTSVASWTHTGAGLTTAFQTVEQTLTAPQLASITNFDNLFVEFQASSVVTGDTTTGLVGYWPMTDNSGTNVNDSSSSNNDITLTSSAIWGTNELIFTGAEEGAAADIAAYRGGSTFTASVWIKGAAQSGKIFFSQYDVGGPDRSWRMHCSDTGSFNKLACVVSNDGSVGAGHYKEYLGSQVCFDSSYHFVCIRFNAGVLDLFVDGVKDTSVTKANDDAITTYHVGTGLGDDKPQICIADARNNNAPAGARFTGSMKKARFYNIAKSDADIAAIYALG